MCRRWLAVNEAAKGVRVCNILQQRSAYPSARNPPASKLEQDTEDMKLRVFCCGSLEGPIRRCIGGQRSQIF